MASIRNDAENKCKGFLSRPDTLNMPKEIQDITQTSVSCIETIFHVNYSPYTQLTRRQTYNV